MLDAISADMNVIENMSYHNLCLLYKGELSLDDLLGAGDGSPAGAAVLYGAANWLYVNGDVAGADEILNELVASPSWAGFGVIAAEADLAAR